MISNDIKKEIIAQLLYKEKVFSDNLDDLYRNDALDAFSEYNLDGTKVPETVAKVKQGRKLGLFKTKIKDIKIERVEEAGNTIEIGASLFFTVNEDNNKNSSNTNSTGAKDTKKTNSENEKTFEKMISEEDPFFNEDDEFYEEDDLELILEDEVIEEEDLNNKIYVAVAEFKIQKLSSKCPTLFDIEIESIDGETELKAPSIGVCGKNYDNLKEFVTLSLEKYMLDEKGLNSAINFINFKHKLLMDEDINREIKKTYYNLLLYSDSASQSMQIWESLLAILKKLSYEHISRMHLIANISEKDAIELKDPSTYSGLINIGNYAHAVIKDCSKKPVIDEDIGTGAMMEKAKQYSGQYNTFWNIVRERSLDHPSTTFVVILDTDTYRHSFECDNERNHRIWGHRIFVPSLTEDYFYRELIEKLKKSSIEFADDFEEKLEKYFKAVYKTADLKRYEFVNDLINRIYSLYFRRGDNIELLDEKCIPKYEENIESIDSIMGDLNRLIGLKKVKSEISRIYNTNVAEMGRDKEKMYHLMFHGNPGTGKTKVAQMIGKIYFRMGICDKQDIISIKANDLISKWGGGVTIAKTARKITEAEGGILFVDEAYTLASYGENGRQILDYLVKVMDEQRDKIIVILAGYDKQMQELMALNTGLDSRVSHIYFDDYKVEELVSILEMKCDEGGFTIDPSCRFGIEDYFNSMKVKENFGNGREAENLYNKLKSAWAEEYTEQARNLGRENVELPRVFYERHIAEFIPERDENISINNLIGLETVKKQIENFKKQVGYQKYIREKGMEIPSFSMHMIFAGNPGTGKTTVARMLANDLYAIGILKTKQVTIATKKDLVIGVTGGSATLTNNIINKAVGGVLFIDEAYGLVGCNETIEALLTGMEDHKDDTVFVFAGYTEEMKRFLEVNPGMNSRIGYHFTFEDYTIDELVTIYMKKMAECGFVVNAKAEEAVKQIMEYFSDSNDFGNGRFVEHIVAMTIEKRARRGYKRTYNDITEKDIPKHIEVIDTTANKEAMYDPDKITKEEKERTAIHELGHAVVSYALDKDLLLDSISINCRSKSLGRVILPNHEGNKSQIDLQNRIAIFLGGRNAEKLFYGTHTTGCYSDYERAKNLAYSMVNHYAMGEIGVTRPKDFLKQADDEATRILQKYQKAIENMKAKLLKGKVIYGKEFKKIMENYDKNSEDNK